MFTFFFLQDFLEPFCGVHYVICTVTSHREARAYKLLTHSWVRIVAPGPRREQNHQPVGTGRCRELEIKAEWSEAWSRIIARGSWRENRTCLEANGPAAELPLPSGSFPTTRLTALGWGKPVHLQVHGRVPHTGHTPSHGKADTAYPLALWVSHYEEPSTQARRLLSHVFLYDTFTWIGLILCKH